MRLSVLLLLELYILGHIMDVVCLYCRYLWCVTLVLENFENSIPSYSHAIGSDLATYLRFGDAI